MKNMKKLLALIVAFAAFEQAAFGANQLLTVLGEKTGRSVSPVALGSSNTEPGESNKKARQIKIKLVPSDGKVLEVDEGICEFSLLISARLAKDNLRDTLGDGQSITVNLPQCDSNSLQYMVKAMEQLKTLKNDNKDKKAIVQEMSSYIVKNNILRHDESCLEFFKGLFSLFIPLLEEAFYNTIFNIIDFDGQSDVMYALSSDTLVYIHFLHRGVKYAEPDYRKDLLKELVNIVRKKCIDTQMSLQGLISQWNIAEKTHLHIAISLLYYQSIPRNKETERDLLSQRNLFYMISEQIRGWGVKKSSSFSLLLNSFKDIPSTFIRQLLEVIEFIAEKKCTVLNLSGINLGSDPECLARIVALEDLKSLGINNCSLNNYQNFPKIFQQLSKLETLSLSGNQLDIYSDDYIAAFKQLTSLKTLYIDGNKQEGSNTKEAFIAKMGRPIKFITLSYYLRDEPEPVTDNIPFGPNTLIVYK